MFRPARKFGELSIRNLLESALPSETGKVAGRLSEKVQMRAEYRRRRAALPAEEHERLGRALEERLLEEEALRQSGTVYTYVAFGREVPTGRAVAALLERGVRVVIPPADRHADPVCEAQLLKALAPRAGEPAVAESLQGRFDPRSVDLFLVPGIVWDPQGFRIGFGGGFFDRLLAAARPDAVKVGLAFEFQLVEQVPAEPWDIPVDRIVTERRALEIRTRVK